jgi:hypothetical protein
VKEWDRALMSVMQPSLDFASPELVNAIKCVDTYSDIFSLGLLAASVFNNCKPVLASKGLVETYKTKMESVSSIGINHVFCLVGKDPYHRCTLVQKCSSNVRSRSKSLS